jgi:hypothetical protein
VLSVATIKRSYQEIAQFDREARAYLVRREANWKNANPESKASPPASKFTYAVNRMLKRSQAVIQDYHEQIEEINIKYCSEDKDGNIATDERGQFKFRREELLKRNKDQRELFKTKTEIEVYMATEVPDDLSQEDKDTFSGFVIPEELEPRGTSDRGDGMIAIDQP